MKLYYSPGASSLSCHVALREARIAADLVRVDLETKTLRESGQSYLVKNPLGKVPAIELDDGSVLTEGAAVLLFIADSAPASNLAPREGTMLRHRLLEALSFVATELHKGYAPMFDPHVPPSYKARLMSDPKPLLRMASLVDAGPWILGDVFSVADAYLFSILRLGRQAGLDFSAWPKVDDYMARVAARPAVREALAFEGL
ncbi:Glutathione S-transferase [Labilithrix luteola]|uniref:Glutathione S-transferase n=1 Tax=Labilithrix luteola TaxID=1391654 RepID=A0A0K1PK27_9BACT|nr:glutathione binding-like protein [Labilithrix luteola]AKU93741.1 Glutathione S-transferase [Labilithrix luteola]